MTSLVRMIIHAGVFYIPRVCHNLESLIITLVLSLIEIHSFSQTLENSFVFSNTLLSCSQSYLRFVHYDLDLLP